MNSKTVYITRQALIEIFNTKYGANFSPDTEFILDEEIVEAKTYTDYLKDQLALTEKTLELAVADKCEFENKVYSMVFGVANGKLACPKKEEWYLERAKEMMKSEIK